MAQKQILVTWAQNASLSAPVWIGTEGPTILRLPVGWQGTHVGFVHYLPVASSIDNAPDMNTGLDLDDDGADLVRAARAGKALLMAPALLGAGWVALRALTGASAQVQSVARTALLIALREGR